MTLLHATGWTLVHFLWQGAIIVAVFLVADSVSDRPSARVRYAIASMAMFLMLACAVTTFVSLAGFAKSREQSRVAQTSRATVVAANPSDSYPQESHSPRYLSWLVYLWMSGVILLSTRMAMQYVRLQRYRRSGLRLLDVAWQERVARIADRLRVRRTVFAYESLIADVPSVVGWLRPVVLVPASALLQLSPAAIEALLAHELAHVRRYDYLANLLQTCVETLFFYHPGVWWVGRRMREERENCCDDLAVAACGDAIVYARALADMEQVRSEMPVLAMAANKGSLLSRIERLIAPCPQARSIAPVGTMALTLLVAGILVWAAPQAPAPKRVPSPDARPVAALSQAPPLPNAAEPQRPRTPKPAPVRSRENYLDELQRAGYRDLTVDQMISMKVHDVTADFVSEMKSTGWSPTPEQLIAFRVHGVNAEMVKQMQSLGFDLTPDRAVTARVHGVDAAYVNGWTQQGLKGLTFDNLIALKIHGADPAQLSAFRALGFNELSAEDLVKLRIFGVTPEFVREIRTRGLRDLRLEQIIKLKQFGILGSTQSK